MTPAPHRFYAGVFLISAALMAMQVIETRIFSVTTWYHLSFLIISITMFGLTMGALRVNRGDEGAQRRDCGALAARACRNFALCTIVALAGQMAFPVVSGQIAWTLVTLPVMAAFVLPPYYFAGVALSLCITRGPFPAARVYGADLLGAAAGCLLSLGMLELADAPSCLLALAACGVAAAGCFDAGEGRRSGVIAAAALALVALNVIPAKPLIYPIWSKDKLFSNTWLDLDRWNAISHVTVTRERPQEPPLLWGDSRLTPPGLKADWRMLDIDGGAGTPITRFHGDCRKELWYFDYDLTTLAYALPGIRTAGIIGAGGGRDILSACRGGARQITAMDVNGIQISLLSRVEPFASYAGIAALPGVRLVHSEARSWLSRNSDTFDLIQMSMIDTWAATGAGAFALSENGLYTVEAWTTFLSRLKPGGVMTVSRWYVKDAPNEVQRMVALAAAALLERGPGEDPARHIFLAGSNKVNPAPDSGHFPDVATIVVARDPLTPVQLDALEARAKKMQFSILLSPRGKVRDAALAPIARARSRDALQRLSDDNAFDISPPTDQRPFFFNQVRLTHPWDVLRLAVATRGSKDGTLGGHARATINLYIIILFSLLASAGVIGIPARRELKAAGIAATAAGTLWFLLIGLGFMLLEISLLQRMSVYLGHPTYGLGIVLFSLVLSTGLGSLLCARFPLKTPRARLGWILCAAAAAALEAPALDAVIAGFADAGLILRAALCVGMILPLGLLLGFGFPTGLAVTNKKSAAWLWGVNGAASVTGSALAVASNIAFGIDHTMMAGAACYALLAVPAWLSRGKAS